MKKTIAWGLLLVLAWCLLQAVLFKHLGVKYMADSQRYEECLLAFQESGQLPAGSNFWYHGYTLFLSFSKPWGKNWNGVILWQVLLSGLAILALSWQTGKFLNNPWAGHILSGLLIGWIPLSTWNFYVLTESPYTSFVMLSLAGIMGLRRPWQVLMVLPVWLFGAWIRPHGVALLLAAGVFMLARWAPKWKTRYWLLLGIGLGLPLLILADRMVDGFRLLEAFYSRGELVANYTLVKSQPYRHLLVVEPPDPLVLPVKEQSAVMQVLAFIGAYPGFFFKQVLGKLFWFVAHIKPYYSLAHNLFIALTLYPAYGLALRGARLLKGKKPFQVFSFTFLAVNTLAVMLTTEAWDGRFLFPLLPLIFIYATVAVVHWGIPRLFPKTRREFP